MSYVKHNYRAGDVLPAADLNEMDDQIAANEAAIAAIPQIDSTLSQQGRPADAKAVGDALANFSAYTFSDPNDDGNIVITAGGDS